MVHPARVCVAVVSYNSAAYLPACLESLRQQTHSNLEIVLVDNASTDGSAQVARHHGVEPIENQANVGFAAATNQAVRLAVERFSPRYLLLLNPDTVADPRLVEEMVGSLEADPTRGIAQGKMFLMRERERLNASGIRHHYLCFGVCDGYRQPDPGPEDREIAVASGACLMVRGDLLDQLGYLFNERFFMYHEDSDLCLRAKLRGYKTVLSGKAVVWHDYRFGTSPQKFFHMEKNRLFLMLQNYRASTLLMLLPAILFTEPQVIGYAALQGWLGSKLRAYGWLVRNAAEIRARRREVATTRVTGDAELLAIADGELRFEELENPILRHLTNPTLKAWLKGVRWVIGPVAGRARR